MKRIIRYIVIITIFILSTVSCETEEIVNEQESIKKGLIFKYVSEESIKTNIALVVKLEKIEFQQEHLFPKNGSSVNFRISYKNIKYLENENSHSYTFQIDRPRKNDTNIENLVLKPNKEGSYDAILVSYDFTSQELKSFDRDELQSKKISYRKLDFDSIGFSSKSGY